jgi:hypothetical protein
VPTRDQQAGLRLEDIPHPSLGQILRRNRLDAKIRRAGGPSDGAGRRTSRYGAVWAGAGGGVLAGCAVRAPQEQASQTYAVVPAAQVSAPRVLSEKGH